MAGRQAKRTAAHCTHLTGEGLPCGRVIPSGWDVCPAHLEEAGRRILREHPERVAVTVEIPVVLAQLGGLSRSEWEAIRLELCAVPVPAEMAEVSE